MGSDLSGKTFLDAGAGSGIHSFAALTIGATNVTSFDYDPDSVAATNKLKEKSPHKKWAILQGSLLDQKFMGNLGKFDVVYSWGVVHHTGDMWKALENLVERVSSGGLVWVSVYNNVEGKFGSAWWQKVKRFYNASPRVLQVLMEWLYISFHFALLLVHGRNPFATMKEYKKKRGMNWKTDLIDWLGGYPYEYATPSEIFLFFKKRGFQLVNLQTTNYKGCNQFLFQAPNA